MFVDGLFDTNFRLLLINAKCSVGISVKFRQMHYFPAPSQGNNFKSAFSQIGNPPDLVKLHEFVAVSCIVEVFFEILEAEYYRCCIDIGVKADFVGL